MTDLTSSDSASAPQRVHLIAVGGSIMHNLALALHRQGARVTGTDDEIFEPARGRLARDLCRLSAWRRTLLSASHSANLQRASRRWTIEWGPNELPAILFPTLSLFLLATS